MSNVLKAFLIIIIFVVGVSVGMYYGEKTKVVEKTVEKIPRDSVQDVVIKNVQDEKIKENTSEVSAHEEKVSPYAKMIIEKKFSKCGHTTTSILDVPKELVNLTAEEIEQKYSGWKVKDFSRDGFTLFRIIEANCDDHYVLKDVDGYLAVYADITENISNLVEKTDILVDTLREDDKIDLEEGIRIYGSGELSSLIEDFSS